MSADRRLSPTGEEGARLSSFLARSPHDLRHTYATVLLMEHYSPTYVQKQLGHHSITMTVDIYGHWIPGEGQVDLDEILRGPVNTEGPRSENVEKLKLVK